MASARVLRPLIAFSVLGTLSVACSASDSDGGLPGSGGSATGAGGVNSSSGGASSGGAGPSSGGSSSGGLAQNAGGTPSGSGGAPGTGSGGQTETGGQAAGGNASGGAASGGAASGGADAGSGGFIGTCTPSTRVNRNVSGSGPHQVIVETNSEPGIREGTIFRPAELGEGERYPIFVWGQGGCSRKGFDAEAAMAQIASHGYFVVADGDPGGSEPNRALGGGGDVLLRYIDWIQGENEKPCSAYHQAIDTEKVAANGFSCGGLMAAGTAADPRMTTWGHTSSGSFSVDQNFYSSIHSPVIIITGTADSLGAHENGQRDYDNISKRNDIPVMMFAKVGADHGGDLWAQNGGHFTRISLAWLNWWLKGDETATGKGMLVGGSCPYCTDNTWIISSANLP